ncbi:hypothetical protein [Streptomyces asiaticus]
MKVPELASEIMALHEKKAVMHPEWAAQLEPLLEIQVASGPSDRS